MGTMISGSMIVWLSTDSTVVQAGDQRSVEKGGDDPRDVRPHPSAPGLAMTRRFESLLLLIRVMAGWNDPRRDSQLSQVLKAGHIRGRMHEAQERVGSEWECDPKSLADA